LGELFHGPRSLRGGLLVPCLRKRGQSFLSYLMEESRGLDLKNGSLGILPVSSFHML
jgi:hypothetical protein